MRESELLGAARGALTVTNNLRFPGQYFDKETGNHYNWNRYYYSSSGRYLQADLIGFSAGDANFFRYVEGNPIIRMDPSGLDWSEIKFDRLDKFIWYGNYGGPSWTSAGWRSWEGIPVTEPLAHPVDSLDWAFLRHDMCYGKCRGVKCLSNRTACFAKCDAVLALTAFKLGVRDPKKWEYAARKAGVATDQSLLTGMIFVLTSTKYGIESAVNAILEMVQSK